MMLSNKEIAQLVEKQLNNLFIFDQKTESEILYKCVQSTMKRVENNFLHNKNKYYSVNGEFLFNPFHSGHYCTFLYYLSNVIAKDAGNTTLADRVYYLNKLLNGVDLFYEIELPDVFFLEHPVGTVMGRAEYANFFSFSQNCTVGNNKGKYPKFNEYISMLSGSKIIGNAIIGNFCIISANTYIKDEVIPDNSIVFGSSPNLIIKKRSLDEMQEYFSKQWKSENE